MGHTQVLSFHQGCVPSFKGCKNSWSGQTRTPKATREFYVAFKEVQSNVVQTPPVLTESRNRKGLFERGETVPEIFSEQCGV